MRRILPLFVAAACGDNGTAPEVPTDTEPTPVEATCSSSDVLASLKALPNVKTVTEEPCGDYVYGTPTCFGIEYDQPVQHANPGGAHFTQHLFLIHRGCDRPTLVADWGYSQEYFFDDELSILYQSNALWIEHRYQGRSVPEVADWDWTALTIENGAADMHAVVTSFRGHYAGNFVSTGASKGGITASYHHFLYPDDLDGAIPYVAPASRSPNDPAYQTYLHTYFPPCAQQLRDAQVAALDTRRPAMEQRLAQFVEPELAPLYLEYLVAHYDWSFWQYYGVEYCGEVPTAASTDDELFNFFAQIGMNTLAAPAEPDEEKSWGALYYEWLTEQGFANQLGSHVRPFITQPEIMRSMKEDFAEMFPDVTLPAYNGRLTFAVRKWARDFADNLLLVYGQYDPWSGGAMDPPTRASSARFFVPDATHAASIMRLHPADRDAALAHATRMFGVSPMLELNREAGVAATQRLERLAEIELRGNFVRLQLDRK